MRRSCGRAGLCFSRVGHGIACNQGVLEGSILLAHENGPNWVLTEEQERALKAKDEFKECTNGVFLRWWLSRLASS